MKTIANLSQLLRAQTSEFLRNSIFCQHAGREFGARISVSPRVQRQQFHHINYDANFPLSFINKVYQRVFSVKLLLPAYSCRLRVLLLITPNIKILIKASITRRIRAGYKSGELILIQFNRCEAYMSNRITLYDGVKH